MKKRGDKQESLTKRYYIPNWNVFTFSTNETKRKVLNINM